MPLPDFVIIGGMKCGTSTLHEQLAAQPGVFMSTPKEPNFFSDDAIYARGLDWYRGLFADAPADALKGEASTHYAKLPTYPDCVARLKRAAPEARIIYVVRDPFARIESHYIHEWTMNTIRCDLETALERHPEMIAYSRYAMQIAPYLEAFGRDAIHVTSLERIKVDPDGELERVGAFLGRPGRFVWRADIGEANVSAERIRRFPLYSLVVENQVVGAIRRALVPKSLRERIKRRFQMRERPRLSEAARARLAPIFKADAAEFGRLFPDFARGGA